MKARSRWTWALSSISRNNSKGKKKNELGVLGWGSKRTREREEEITKNDGRERRSSGAGGRENGRR
jgi:hypothetical protein